MALLLALDTSTPYLSAALVSAEGAMVRTLATRAAGPLQITSTLVPGVFDELLREAVKSIEELDVIVAGLGPGLFTGARVAVATMKAIAYARRRPLIGAESLEAMSLSAAVGHPLAAGESLDLGAIPSSPLLCPVLDARKGEVYWALYQARDGRITCVAPPVASPPTVLAQRLGETNETVRLFGTGGAVVQRVAAGLDRVAFDSAPLTPGAAEIAALAWSRHPDPAYDPVSILALEPVYLRPPEAEVARQRRAAATRTPAA